MFHRPRFVLDVDFATRFLDSFLLSQETADLMPAEFDCPSVSLLNFSADWYPRTATITEVHELQAQVETLLFCGEELNFLKSSHEGIRLVFNLTSDGWYSWTVEAERYSGLRLSGEETFVKYIGTPELFGRDAAIGILQEAVHSANILLNQLFDAAPMIAADISTNPLELTILAQHDEGIVRSAVVENPNTPEEAQVIIGLKKLDK